MAIFQWIDGSYNPRGIQASLGVAQPPGIRSRVRGRSGLVDPGHRQACTGPRSKYAMAGSLNGVATKYP
jgi:hypothetical protein